MISLKYGHSVKRRPVNLFFIEIIIALLFFSISGAVIMKVFAVADGKTRRSALLEDIVITAQSIAELYSCGNDAADAVREALKDGSIGGDLSAVPVEGGKVILSASERRESAGTGEMRRLSMKFTLDGSEIYSLDCSAYVPGGGADG